MSCIHRWIQKAFWHGNDGNLFRGWGLVPFKSKISRSLFLSTNAQPHCLDLTHCFQCNTRKYSWEIMCPFLAPFIFAHRHACVVFCRSFVYEETWILWKLLHCVEILKHCLTTSLSSTAFQYPDFAYNLVNNERHIDLV